MIGEGEEKMFTTANVVHILPASSASSLLGKYTIWHAW